jgi:hypothetical protein
MIEERDRRGRDWMLDPRSCPSEIVLTQFHGVKMMEKREMREKS